MLLGQVTLIQVKFLQCDDKMGPEDYQELQNSDKLDGKKKLLAFIWKEEEIMKVKKYRDGVFSCQVFRSTVKIVNMEIC